MCGCPHEVRVPSSGKVCIKCDSKILSQGNSRVLVRVAEHGRRRGGALWPEATHSATCLLVLSPRLPSRVGGRVESQVGLAVRNLVQVWREKAPRSPGEPFTCRTRLASQQVGGRLQRPSAVQTTATFPPPSGPRRRRRGGGGSRARSVLSTSPALTGLLAAAAIRGWGTEEEEGVELSCGWTRSSQPAAAGASQLFLALPGSLRASA